MKKKSLFLLAVIGFTISSSSCVEEDYDWSKVDKEMAFSNEHGLSFRIGQLNKIEIPQIDGRIDFPDIPDIPGIPEDIEDILWDPIHVTLDPETYTGLFTEEMYDFFVYDNNGKDEPLGAIILESKLEVKMTNPDAHKISDIKIEISIVDKNGKDVGIAIDPKTPDPHISEHNFDIIIREEDVTKLKNADGLRFTFSFSAAYVTEGDYVQLKNIWLKLTGGVSLSSLSL